MSFIAKTRQQIAREYGVSTKTLKKWFCRKELQIDSGLISPKDQKLIYEKLGVPKISD